MSNEAKHIAHDLAQQRMVELDIQGSHKQAGFYLGYQKAYEDAHAALKRRHQAFVPGHTANVWDWLLHNR